ncbi:unnamed protein product [Thlaspi arvense]|uniref:Uncharacterized protein n=1 Tax=Thlaspi arvense TaxID=13288 RepID=A0AAU9RRY4_THLAR|nr:unnamed protein product [Thlaspi arvense]
MRRKLMSNGIVAGPSTSGQAPKRNDSYHVLPSANLPAYLEIHNCSSRVLPTYRHHISEFAPLLYGEHFQTLNRYASIL